MIHLINYLRSLREKVSEFIGYVIAIYNISILNKKLIAYSKKHPIYTSVFNYPSAFGDFHFYLINKTILSSTIGSYIIKKTDIFHIDASNAENYVPKLNAKFIIECEGKPYPEFFQNDKIRKIFVESKWAGGEYFVEGKVDLLYPAIEENKTKKRNTLSKNKPITLCAVGYGGMLKGFDVVSKVYFDLKEKYRLKLIIAGQFGHNFQWYPEISKEAYSKADFDSISDQLKLDENVIFKSYKRNNLFKEVYPQADIYLHLSRLETFGYSILEAMSFGLPVVASNLHAIPEMVIHDFNGFLVDGFDYDINSQDWYDSMLSQTKDAVSKLIDNHELLLKFGNNSKSLIEEKFNIENKKRILIDCYDKLLQE